MSNLAYTAVSISLRSYVAIPAKTAFNLLVLASLEDGWMRGQGKKPTAAVMKAVRVVTDKIYESRPKSIEHFPEINGGLMVSGVFDGYVIDVLCRSDGLFDFCLERQGVCEPDEEAISLDAVINFIQEKSCRHQPSYSYSTQDNIAKNSADTKVWRSRTQQVAEYLSLSQSARPLLQEAYAAT